MTTMTIQDHQQAGPLAELNPASLPQSPAWLQPMREQALARFNKLGLPTTRDEDWRFTNVAPIRDALLELSPNGQAVTLSQRDADTCAVPGVTGSRLVFVNGRFNASLSSIKPLPQGVRVLSLAEAIETEQALLKTHLGKLADFEDQPFTALNAALADDGVVVCVPRGKQVDEPIYLLNITTADKPLLINPRNLIVVEESAAVTVIEDYVSLNGEGVYLNNAVTEVVVGDNAHATHYMLDRESTEAFNISSLYSRQGRDSRFESHTALLGGSIVRNNVTSVLDGEGAWSQLNGLYVIRGDQTADNHMRVVHAKPHGDSRQFYKGIMNDRAKGVFRGRIVVDPDAQKTDAKQSNQNLLLSPDAGVNTDPQLEIFADDVKCTHGATIGQLNEEQVFYLRSRGVPYDTARAMIIYAFASETIDRMGCEPIRRLLKGQLLDRLPAGEVLKKIL